MAYRPATDVPKSDPDIYIYKMIADTGGAPCVTEDLLSLAICKPTIRKTAATGSLIFGFGGKRYEERLLYVALVTQKPAVGDYYRKREFARRGDCIYREVDGKATRKSNARYHREPGHARTDVGHHFENAFVLLSEDFRYLGHKGTSEYKVRFPEIRNMIEAMKRGHRRYHSPGLRTQLLALKRDLWQEHQRMEVGSPTDSDRRLPCNRESPSGRC